MHRVGSAGNTASSTRPRKEKRFTYVLNDADDTKHCAGINCLAYLKASTSDSCDYLFSGSRDGTLKRWALKDQKPTFSGTFESHVDWRVTNKRNRVSIQDRMWARLLSSTNQPSFMEKKDMKPASNSRLKPPSLLSKPMNAEPSVQTSTKLPPTKPVLITENQQPPEEEKSPLTDIIEEAPPAVNTTAIELKTSDSDQSDTHSDSGTRKSSHEKKHRVRSQSLSSFGRHSMKHRGSVESPVATPSSMSSPSQPSTPTGRGAEGHKKAKQMSGRNPWRLHRIFLKRSPSTNK